MKFKLFQILFVLCVLDVLFYTVFKKSIISSSYVLLTFGEKVYGISPFQQIVENFYSLSAFYDERSKGLKVLGIAALDEFPNVTCKYFLDNTFHNPDLDLIDVVAGNPKCFKDYQLGKRSFLYIWIECPLAKSTLLEYNSKLKVQIIVDSAAGSHDDDYKLTTGEGHFIENSPRDNESSTYKYKMAMCIQPLFNYEEPLLLAEWIEFHKLLGVQHFTFYNMSIGPKSSKLLNSYNNSTVKVLPWILPFDKKIKPLNYHGQILQINDCLYRYKGVAEFVGFVDVDEFITPGDKYLNNFTTYDTFFQDLFAKSGPQVVAGVQFLAKFSFHNFPKRNKTDGLANKLRILTRPKLASSWQFIYKTKVVLKPEFVLEEEVHWPTLLINGTKVLKPSEEDLYFIHYRVCDQAYLGYFCRQNCTTCDDIHYSDEDSILDVRFGNELLQNVKNRLELSHI